jgi:hypothetical protein
MAGFCWIHVFISLFHFVGPLLFPSDTEQPLFFPPPGVLRGLNTSEVFDEDGIPSTPEAPASGGVDYTPLLKGLCRPRSSALAPCSDWLRFGLGYRTCFMESNYVVTINVYKVVPTSLFSNLTHF